MEMSLSQPAVKILFDGSNGFDVMRWTIILPEKQKKNGYRICLGKELVKNIYII